MSFSSATVVATVQLDPCLRRITLQVDDPRALDVPQAGDSAVGVYFDAASLADGRNYSVRHHRPHPDGDRIDLDVMLHARGVGTSWASVTSPGDRVGLDHARSWYRPAPTTDWQLLVADLSGLPATARIIEQLPGGQPVTAIVEVAEQAELDYLPTHPDVCLVPSVGTGNGYTPSKLAQLVREFTRPDGHGYCWFAGEAAESRTVRKYFRSHGWTFEQLDVTGYWRFDSETWDARYALVSDDIEAIYVRALADGKGNKVADEEYDAALERAGL